MNNKKTSEKENFVALDDNKNSERERKNQTFHSRTAFVICVVSIGVNLALTVFKLIAGIIGNSYAMISDAIHSASDVLSTLIVMIGVKVASKKADRKHPYGHERFECVAAIILAVMLAVTGGVIGCCHTYIPRAFGGDRFHHNERSDVPCDQSLCQKDKLGCAQSRRLASQKRRAL